MTHYLVLINGQLALMGVHHLDTAVFLARHGHQVVAGPGSLLELMESVEFAIWLRSQWDNL